MLGMSLEEKHKLFYKTERDKRKKKEKEEKEKNPISKRREERYKTRANELADRYVKKKKKINEHPRAGVEEKFWAEKVAEDKYNKKMHSAMDRRFKLNKK